MILQWFANINYCKPQPTVSRTAVLGFAPRGSEMAFPPELVYQRIPIPCLFPDRPCSDWADNDRGFKVNSVNRRAASSRRGSVDE